MAGRIKTNEKSNRLPFPIIGRVACGEKSEKGYPRSLDYFVASGKYAELFKRAYGDKPSTIQIVFLNDDAELCCKEFYELRDTAGKLVSEGDGETFKVWSDKTKAYTFLSTNDYPDLMNMIAGKYPKCEWKITLTLNFIIPKVRGIMGLWSFSTKGSASTIPQVRDTFDAMLEQNGHASGVIFDLSVKMHTSQKPNTASKYPVVSLVPNESEENLRMVKESRKPIMITE
jgi:hypothetical protein